MFTELRNSLQVTVYNYINNVALITVTDIFNKSHWLLYIVIIGSIKQTHKNTIDEQTDGKSILLNHCITQWFMDNV